MEKISLWKRVGGWLRRSHLPRADDEMLQLDAEGLIADSDGVDIDGNNKDNHNGDSSGNDSNGDDFGITAVAEDAGVDEANHKSKSAVGSAIFPRHKKEQQLAAMEEGFNRLVTVMESINENMQQQKQETQKLNAHLENLPGLLSRIPDVVESQVQTAQAMAEELKKQSLQQQQLNETIRKLPDLTKSQLDKLSDITAHMESSLENEVHMAETFSRFDGSMQIVADSAQAQATSLAHIGQMLEQNEQKMQQILSRQNKRFMWLAVVVIIASLAAIALVLYSMFGSSAGG